MKYHKKCDRFQKMWSFMQWAINLVGLMPMASAKIKMMIFPTTTLLNGSRAKLYFTKEVDVERFVWRNLFAGLAVHNHWLSIMAHNSLASKSPSSLKKYGIKKQLSTLSYSQGNGQAKASNKIILYYLKKERVISSFNRKVSIMSKFPNTFIDTTINKTSINTCDEINNPLRQALQ